MDTSVRPSKISVLEFDLDGWGGDGIVEAFPALTPRGYPRMNVLDPSGGRMDRAWWKMLSGSQRSLICCSRG
jgi:hypothetical protein